ncbi:hypothetical protein FIU87_07220 [Bacillus sp. THAF10]|nr:hypothetical protein [Bacillus sp. THAF10]QFT88429.1 hypothetical protein FIU87_07220 [Bacillus sp. THAF10]
MKYHYSHSNHYAKEPMQIITSSKTLAQKKKKKSSGCNCGKKKKIITEEF